VKPGDAFADALRWVLDTYAPALRALDHRDSCTECRTDADAFRHANPDTTDATLGARAERKGPHMDLIMQFTDAMDRLRAARARREAARTKSAARKAERSVGTAMRRVQRLATLIATPSRPVAASASAPVTPVVPVVRRVVE
jgi:hypothetical protein